MKKVMNAVAALMLMTAIGGCTKPDEPNNGSNDNSGSGGDGSITHEYVDLGLPSGTLWATCNVGADTPEGYGDYFAWGETEPKDVYNWETYKLCNGNSDSFNKYCSTDGLMILQPSDDAATANWGNKWCMPSTIQWEELCHNITHTWITQAGVSGYLFTANNGNSIFLPAAGSGEDGPSEAGFDGTYWANSLDINSDVYAMRFSFSSDSYQLGSNRRRYGFSVCPVRSVQ